MSYADPQTINSLGGFTSLPRTGAGPTSGSFSSSDGTVQLSVSHANGKRLRSQIRLTQSKVSADPLIPSQNVRNSMSAYVVIDRPVNGFTVTEAKAVADVLVAYLTASTGARITQLLGGES
jgi:hypothetical protein